MKKVNIFLSLISESETHIDSLHIEWNILSLYFLKLWGLLLTDNENPQFSVSEKLEYYIRFFLWYSTPWTATPVSNDPLWLTLFGGGC